MGPLLLMRSSWMLPAWSPALVLSDSPLCECRSDPYLALFSLSRTWMQTNLLALKCQMHQWTLRGILEKSLKGPQQNKSSIPWFEFLTFMSKKSWHCVSRFLLLLWRDPGNQWPKLPLPEVHVSVQTQAQHVGEVSSWGAATDQHHYGSDLRQLKHLQCSRQWIVNCIKPERKISSHNSKM